LTLEPSFEQKIIDSRAENASTVISAMELGLQKAWIKALSRAVAASQEKGWFPVILCSENARLLVKSSCERELPELGVLSLAELVSDITVEVVGEIRPET
jgi:flagellar biosynthesis protein FlhA